MKTSLKTGVAQIFSCCPEKMGGSKIWGGGGGGGGEGEGLQPLHRPPGPYATLNETKKDKLFFKQLRTSYLLE